MGANYHYDVSTTGTPPQAEMFSLSKFYFSSNFNYFAITYLLPLMSLPIVMIVDRCTDKADKAKKERIEQASELLH